MSDERGTMNWTGVPFALGPEVVEGPQG